MSPSARRARGRRAAQGAADERPVMPSLGEIAAYASLATVIGAGLLVAAGYSWLIAVAALVAGGVLIGVVMFAASHVAVPLGRRARPSSSEKAASRPASAAPAEAPAAQPVAQPRPLRPTAPPHEAPSELPTRPIAAPRPPRRPSRPPTAGPPDEVRSTLWPTSSYPPPQAQPEPPRQASPKPRAAAPDAPRKPGRRRKK